MTNQHYHRNIYLTVAAVFIISIIAATAILDLRIFNFQPNSNTLLTPPQNLYVQPQDDAHIIGDEYYGSFWVFNVAVTANEDVAGVKLDKDTQGSVTYQGATEALKTGASVEVKIDPQQPYITRAIQEKQVMIVPAATGSGTTKDGVYMRYYDWGEGSGWRIYTPFLVSVYKDGALVGSATLDMEGGSNIQTIPTSEGPVRIENLGTLGGNYLSPSFPAQIVIVKGYSNVYELSQVQTIMNGAQTGTVSGSASGSTHYADYWYGNSRNAANQAYNPIIYLGMQQTVTFSPSSYGGWKGNTASTVAPIAPVIGPSDKSTLPEDKRSFYSLTEFIEQKGIQNLASTLFNTRATGNVGSLWQKASFVTDSNGQTALRLDIPWSAFGTPLVTIRVPTELADTWIDRPTVADAQISAVWEESGTDHSDVYGANRIKVTVTNTGSVTASTNLAISTDNSKLSVTPLSMTVPSLAPGDSTTVYFDATNLGVEDETKDIPVTITASDTYTNTQTDTVTIYGTLKATLTYGTTTLKIHAVDKTTGAPIAGLPLTLTYSTTATPYTDANGVVSLTLATPQGGAYTGTLTASSQTYTNSKNIAYKAASATYNLPTATAYEYTYEVERVGTANPTNWLTIILIALAVTIALIIVAAVAYMMHKKRSRRRKK